MNYHSKFKAKQVTVSREHPLDIRVRDLAYTLNAEHVARIVDCIS
jgi:hypothetical protein